MKDAYVTREEYREDMRGINGRMQDFEHNTIERITRVETKVEGIPNKVADQIKIGYTELEKKITDVSSGEFKWKVQHLIYPMVVGSALVIVGIIANKLL